MNSTKMNKVKKIQNRLEIDIHHLLISPPKEIWIDRSYLNKDGKFQKDDERTEDTRMELMGRITYELIRFKEHNDHVEWWKKVWPEMKKDLKHDHVILRWDFIGTPLYL